MSNVVQAADFLSGMGLGMVADQLKELKAVSATESNPAAVNLKPVVCCRLQTSWRV
jgi:hypothetical protein